MNANSPSTPILIVDDEPNVLTGMKLTLRSAELTNVLCCSDGRQALIEADNQPVSMVILDLLMPGLPGETVLEKFRQKFSNIPVVIVTAVHDIAKAVECMRNGAFDYLPKPVKPAELIQVTKRALQSVAKLAAITEPGAIKDGEPLKQPEAFAAFLTQSPKMKQIFHYVESVAKTSFPVLITGETGVGKEIVARAVHDVSGRPGEYVSLNAAGVDDNVFADTLFGHIKGAFTGAAIVRRGLLDRADKGTIFLDEIGDLSPASQVKLLRLVQEKEYLPLGADVPKKVDARIVAATCRDLRALQSSASFRQDLYFRLSVHKIHIPPLRRRREDIALLVDHFVKMGADAMQIPKPQIPKALFEILSNRNYVGNVRELQALIFDAISLHKGAVLSLDYFLDSNLQDQIQTLKAQRKLFFESALTDTDPLPTLKEAQQVIVKEAIKRTNGSISGAARLLGITPQALGQRLQKEKQN